MFKTSIVIIFATIWINSLNILPALMTTIYIHNNITISQLHEEVPNKYLIVHPDDPLKHYAINTLSNLCFIKTMPRTTTKQTAASGINNFSNSKRNNGKFKELIWSMNLMPFYSKQKKMFETKTWLKSALYKMISDTHSTATTFLQTGTTKAYITYSSQYFSYE